MAPSTEQVLALMSVTFPTSVVESAIADAALLLPESCSYPTERKTAILKYLAAHFLSSSQKGAQGKLAGKSIDGASYSLRGAMLGQGLKGTTFGQQALLLDVDKCIPDIDGIQLRMWNL